MKNAVAVINGRAMTIFFLVQSSNLKVSIFYNSFLGHNTLLCMQRYKCSLHDTIIGNSNHVVKQYCNSSMNDDQLLTASFLSELIAIRDRRLNFSNGFFFSNCELSDIISYACTS
jgi:hypothetical protein